MSQILEKGGRRGWSKTEREGGGVGHRRRGKEARKIKYWNRPPSSSPDSVEEATSSSPPVAPA
jgi:hypothetical protein